MIEDNRAPAVSRNLNQGLWPRVSLSPVQQEARNAFTGVGTPRLTVLSMEAPPLERRLAAILAADVEGYSRLMHGDE